MAEESVKEMVVSPVADTDVSIVSNIDNGSLADTTNPSLNADNKSDGSLNSTYRCSSPGMAQRVVTNSDQGGTLAPDDPSGTNSKSNSASVINDMTQRLADNLLVAPSVQVSKPEYISINKKLEIEKQKELAGNAQSQGNLPDDIPSVHPSSSYNNLHHDDSGSSKILLPTQSKDMNMHDPLVGSGVITTGDPLRSGNQSRLEIDIGALNMTKPSTVNIGAPPSTQTLFNHTSNGQMETADSDLHASQEVDILTAMSGEPIPNSLPLVTDGISDGEISSDSDVDNSETADLNIFVKTNRQPQTNGQCSDPFFAQHKSIMKSKTPEQVAEMRATVQSIRSAAAEQAQTEIFNTPAKQSEKSDSPIWEIRESYAETLRNQEEKRRQRMELERRYEQEYREKHLQEIEQLEADDNKIMAPQTLDDDRVEQMNEGTDYYSSDDEDVMNYNGDAEIGRGWGWSASSKYSRVSNAEGYERSTILPSSGHIGNMSNASRLAEHQMNISPKTSRHFGHSRLSNSSYSSSSQSSMAASTVVRCEAHAPPSPISNSDSSSSNSWDQDCRDTESPANLLTPSSRKKREQGDYDTDEETDRLLNKPYQGEGRVDLPADTQELGNQAMKNKAKEVTVYDPDEPTVLIEGILFRAAYLGSTQLMSDPQPSKAIRMLQAQEAVGRIKAREGESQPSTDVDLFVSTEKVMVLNTDLQEIMMDHALRSISYIADIDNILVIMAKRSLVLATSSSSSGDEQSSLPATAQQKLICHIFETDEAHLIAQSIGQAFQVAYMEFLKANGIDDPNLHIEDTSYEDILEQQEIMHDELETFTRKDKQKDVIVPKAKGEALGIVIVESGWGSMLPTVILANMSPVGAAARCGHLNIGDQIMSVNGISLVGLPLSTCQEHVKAVKNLTAVRLCIVSRPPVVEVLIKRPDKKYQLGFSVQNGVICSLLRGGIAERGGIRVGHRIIEINGQSVVAVAHEKIVHTLSTSIGEIHMKTMPMAVFRLLTGQEVPQYI